jgi:hypothetical protein
MCSQWLIVILIAMKMPLQTTIKTVAVLGLLIGAPLVQADSFGSGVNTFAMDFVDIGDAGNANDGLSGDTAFGGVSYNYRMGVNEVSRSMIDAYNTNSGGPTLTMSDMTSLGGNGANRPATGVSWNEAARFVNWLNISTGHAAAYQFDTAGANDNIALWEVGDAGYDASNKFRNSNAHYFLPSEDEWYKAAYYDGDSGTYYDYATGSDTKPTAVAGGTTAGTAVFGQSWETGPADITNAGGLSPYGTMAQMGNVIEWGESGITAPNDSADENRVFLGGKWNNSFEPPVTPPITVFLLPTSELSTIGFRVAAVPEPPSTLTMVYAPDALPNPTVTLTWSKTGAAHYIAKYSTDMSDWGADFDDNITAVNDENPDDPDHITVTFELTDGLENEPKMFFRIEEE